MMTLLKVEWMKLKNYRTFWILSVLYLVSLAGSNYIVYQIQQQIYNQNQAKGMAEMALGSPPYDFPEVWQMASYVSSYLLFLPGLLMIMFITNEFSFKTHRQNIIDGWSRRDFISVKMVLAAISAAISVVVVFITALFFGMAGKSALSFDGIYHLGYFFIQAFSYNMVALLFAIIFKRGALAIGVFFLYSLVLENIISLLLNRYANNAGRYLPLESTDLLIPLPFARNIQNQIVEPVNFTIVLIVTLVYLGLYIFLGLRKFETDDL